MKTSETKTTTFQHLQSQRERDPFFRKDGAGAFGGKTKPEIQPFFQRESYPRLQTKNATINQSDKIQNQEISDQNYIQRQENEDAEPIELSKKERTAIKKYGDKYDELKIELSDELSEFEDELSIQNYLRPIMKERYEKEDWWAVKPPKSKRVSQSTDWTYVEYADELFFQNYDIGHGTDVHIEIKKEIIDDYFTPSKSGFQHEDLFIGTDHIGGTINISVVNPSTGKDELEIFMCDEAGTVLREVLPASGASFNIHKKGESFGFQVNQNEAIIRIISYRASENTAEGSAEPHDFTFYKIESEMKTLRKKPVRFAKIHSIPKPGKAQRLRHGRFKK